MFSDVFYKKGTDTAGLTQSNFWTYTNRLIY